PINSGTVSGMPLLNFKFDPQVKMDMTTGIRYVNLDNQNIYISVTTYKDVADLKLLAVINRASRAQGLVGGDLSSLELPVEYVDTAAEVGYGSEANSEISINMRYVHTYVIKLDESATAIRKTFGDSVNTNLFHINIELIETNNTTGPSSTSDSFNVMFNERVPVPPVPQPSTIEWIIPSNAYMKINGQTVGSADVAPYTIKAGNPLNIEAGYIATTELPTLIILEEVSANIAKEGSNKVFFYPVLERIDELNTIASASQKIKPSSYEYIYSSQIYKDLKPNTSYKITFKVYPDTTQEKISLREYNYAYKNYVKSVSTVLSFSKAPKYSNRFILRDMFGTDNGNGWAYGTVEGPQSTTTVKSIDKETSVETSSGQTIMSSGQVHVVLPTEGKVKPMRPTITESNVVTAISEEDIMVDTANSGQEASVYLNQNNLTRKIKSIDTAFSEGQINSENVYGDVQLVNVDDVPKYVFTVKEKNMLFGFIPFGTKKVEKMIDATENLE
ncbi:MAG: hypothetical protein WCF78_03000, partial [archaeon]